MVVYRCSQYEINTLINWAINLKMEENSEDIYKKIQAYQRIFKEGMFVFSVKLWKTEQTLSYLYSTK